MSAAEMMDPQAEATKAGSPYLNLTAAEQLTWIRAANESLYVRMQAEVAKNGRRSDAWEIMADEYDRRSDLIGHLEKQVEQSRVWPVLSSRDVANTET